MRILENLEPKEVFQYFEDICNIPHGSYKEKQISDYCVAFAKEHGLEVIQDELFNIIMKKPATKGYENVPAIILQGHMDMVCEKDSDCDIDMDKEGLRLKIDGDYIEADGTTLGGDNGIAVAYALAILASDRISHPALEVVFTVSEEVGMEGAAFMDLSSLKGKKLLNMDNEEEGVFLTSCAGGARVNCSLKIAHEEKEGQLIEVSLTGLKGGHSGTEIDKGRANADTLMGRFLLELCNEMSYELASLCGGSKDNAIPRESTAVILIQPDEKEKFEKAREKYLAIYRNEYSVSEPDMQLNAKLLSEGKCMVLVKESKMNALLLMSSLPNGVQSMSLHVPELVETSLNLGIVAIADDKITYSYAVRSSIESAKRYLIQKLTYITQSIGGEVEVVGVYPGWEYVENSKLREDMIRVYTEMYGKAPKIEALHAGVECGWVSDKIDGVDCVSFGPDMEHVHTSNERLSIPSTRRVWEYLLNVIACK